MKVFVLYVCPNEPTAIYMGTNREDCEKELEEVKKRYKQNGWQGEIKLYIQEYDFSKDNFFELDC